MSDAVDPRITAAIEHLQRAALELIAAARNALDVAEDLTRDPAPLQSLLEGVLLSFTGPGSGGAAAPEDDARPAPEPRGAAHQSRSTAGDVSGRAVGVDVGGTKLLAVAIDSAGTVVAEERVLSQRDASQLIDGIAAVAGAVGPVGGLCVGLPGLVEDGVLRFAANLPGIVELPVAAMLEERLGVPVVLGNDATLAAWGERSVGAAVGVDDALMVTLGTGIGGGLILGGRLYTGGHGMAGEIGHVLVDPAGPPCPCGQSGCWERYASGSGLGRLGGVAAGEGRAPALLAAAGGDALAVRGEHVVSAAGRATRARWRWSTSCPVVAIGLANLVNIFDPVLIVLGGGLIQADDVLLGPIRAQVMGYVEAANHRPRVEIRPALLGERAGALGAAFWARENFFS